MKDKSNVIYFTTIIVIAIVYLVIYLFGITMKKSIYSGEYENNLTKQPINNIISYYKKEDSNNNNNNNNHNNNSSNNSNNNTNNNNANNNQGSNTEPDDNEEYDDENIVFVYEAGDSNYIELYNQFPTKDEVGKAFSGNKYTQDFRIRLNADATNVSYTITLKKQDGSTLEDKWTKVYLEADGVGVSNCFRANGRVKTFNEYVNYSNDGLEKVIYMGKITYAEAQRGYKDFTLRMWVSEDLKLYNENLLEKSFKAIVTIYAER